MREGRPPPAHQGRLRPHRARPAPGPHRPAAQDEALRGHGPHRDLRHRRRHRHDRRPHRPQHRPPAHDARGDRAQRRDLPGAGLQDSGPRENRGPLQQRMARPAALRGHDPPVRQVHRGAPAGARRLLQALSTTARPSPSTSCSIRWRRPTIRSPSTPTSSWAAPTRSSTCWWAARSSAITASRRRSSAPRRCSKASTASTRCPSRSATTSASPSRPRPCSPS